MDIMSNHTWTAHQVTWNRDFQCEKCDHTFYSIEALENHENAMNHSSKQKPKAEDKSTEFKCGKCERFSFSSKEALERHETAMNHKSQQVSMSDQVLTFMSKDFKCKKCEHTFYSADALSLIHI